MQKKKKTENAKRVFGKHVYAHLVEHNKYTNLYFFSMKY